jgi:hypothetical protein
MKIGELPKLATRVLSADHLCLTILVLKHAIIYLLYLTLLYMAPRLRVVSLPI